MTSLRVDLRVVHFYYTDCPLHKLCLTDRMSHIIAVLVGDVEQKSDNFVGHFHLRSMNFVNMG